MYDCGGYVATFKTVVGSYKEVPWRGLVFSVNGNTEFRRCQVWTLFEAISDVAYEHYGRSLHAP